MGSFIPFQHIGIQNFRIGIDRDVKLMNLVLFYVWEDADSGIIEITVWYMS